MMDLGASGALDFLSSPCRILPRYGQSSPKLWSKTRILGRFLGHSVSTKPIFSLEIFLTENVTAKEDPRGAPCGSLARSTCSPTDGIQNQVGHALAPGGLGGLNNLGLE